MTLCLSVSDVKPKPACLVIDLGNGADLDVVQADPGALAARTVCVDAR